MIASAVSATDEVLASVDDPAIFTANYLRGDLWDMQVQIMRAIATSPRVAVKACHASSKTWTAARIALWWLIRWLHDGIVLTTAPTWPQVEKLLWREIRDAVRLSRFIPWPSPNLTELKLSDRNYAVGLSTNEGVRFQGFHGARLLVILDEAPGVRPEIWEAIEGARAGGDVRILALGNPTIASGAFYDAFTAHRDHWRTFTISAFDTPNLHGLTLEDLLALPDDELDVAERPYLTTRRWVREKFDEWGPRHPLWESRVMGQFPTQADDALLSLAWVEQARLRPVHDDGTPIAVGIDVAGPGEDETVVTARTGSVVLWERAFTSSDPRGEIVALLEPLRERLAVVNVDTVGIGYYLAQHLADGGLPVCHVNVGEASSDAERYRNKKAELYWALRQRFEAGDMAGAFPDVTVSQLVSIRYKHNARGQLEIESKDDARKRGVRSPDRAEALMLAFAPTQEGVVLGSQQAWRPPKRAGRRIVR